MRAALLICCAVAGCATLDEASCRAGDWRGIGQADGEAGRGVAHVARHAEACADYGIAPDREAWLDGRSEGLLSYCTPMRAYRLGRSGRQIAPVCPATARAAMDPAWSQGWRYHRLEREIEEIRRDIRELERLLLAHPDDIELRSYAFRELSRLRFKRQRLELRQLRYARWP